MSKRRVTLIEDPLAAAKEMFLEVYGRTGSVRLARQLSGLPDPRKHYKEDEEFRAQWDSKKKSVTDALESAAFERALKGTKKPVIYKGEITEWYREYSDTLLMFLLRAHLPDVYKASSDMNLYNHPLTAPVEGNVREATKTLLTKLQAS